MGFIEDRRRLFYLIGIIILPSVVPAIIYWVCLLTYYREVDNERDGRVGRTLTVNGEEYEIIDDYEDYEEVDVDAELGRSEYEEIRRGHGQRGRPGAA